jgi:hypothetical protein
MNAKEVQEFKSSGVQEFNSSTLQLSNSPTRPPVLVVSLVVKIVTFGLT